MGVDQLLVAPEFDSSVTANHSFFSDQIGKRASQTHSTRPRTHVESLETAIGRGGTHLPFEFDLFTQLTGQERMGKQADTCHDCAVFRLGNPKCSTGSQITQFGTVEIRAVALGVPCEPIFVEDLANRLDDAWGVSLPKGPDQRTHLRKVPQRSCRRKIEGGIFRQLDR